MATPHLNGFDKAFLWFLFSGFAFGQAAYQMALFAKGKTIDHTAKSALYAVFALFMAGAYWLSFGHWVIGVKVLGAAVLVRAAFFDPILNIMRKNEWYYNGAINDGQHGSWVDQLEDKLINRSGLKWRRNLKILKISYVIILVLYTIFIL